MLMAIAERLALKPKERMGKIARDAGYSYTGGFRDSWGKFRLDELGKVQQAGKHGGFRRKRPPHERRALYKRVLQSIIREPFREYREIASDIGISPDAFKAIIVSMQASGAMQPNFLETQHIRAVYKADTGGLPQKKLASKLGISESAVWKYRQRIKKSKEFTSTHNKPVEWVLNRYGTLMKAGLLK